ncbi:MAG: DHHA1 domain-containing protein, partial [Acidobacteriota bacterium]|nr:DHHA1 domain-containing protein [Acidobacteriota bacterium]
RTSLRSKGDVNVARIAERFGGGGHRNAAGCTFQGTWEEAERQVVAQLVEAVESRGANGNGGGAGAGAATAGGHQDAAIPPERRNDARDART